MEVEALWCCSKCGAVFRKEFPRCPNDGAEIVLRERDPLLGTRIGNYEVEDFIGEGGMGRVYRARHRHLGNKLCAIKVLVGDVAVMPSMRARFIHEAEVASRLQHPNLVGVLDFGLTDGGLPYIAMDYVDGLALDDLANGRPMDPDRVVRIARDICAGLVYAHDAGVIHRDLKPGNVLVVHGGDGREVARITDFGLVMSLDQSAPRLTTTGVAMGTPAYASPEQLAGSSLDARTDLYALGMTMYEMLTGGVLPWDGSPLDIATAKTRDRAPTIAERVPGVKVPAELQQLVTELVERNRDDRPASARDVLARLEAGARREARIRTEPADRPRAARKLAIAAALAVAGIAGAASYVVLARDSGSKSEPPPKLAKTEPTAASEHPRAAPSPSPAEPARAAPPAPSPSEPAIAAPAQRPPATAAPAHSPPAAPPPTPPRRPGSRTRAHPTVVARRPDPNPPAPRASPGIAMPEPEPIAPPPPPPPPAPTPTLHATIARVEARGSLPLADVERAVRRTAPALDRCTVTAPARVVARFEIGEMRRASNMSASGGLPATNTCVANVLASVRTEAAPDTGEVAVTVTVAFEAK